MRLGRNVLKLKVRLAEEGAVVLVIELIKKIDKGKVFYAVFTIPTFKFKNKVR